MFVSSSENIVKRDTNVDLPDLIDTCDSNYTTEDTLNMPNAINSGDKSSISGLVIGLEMALTLDLVAARRKMMMTPFADVSIHPNEKKSADDFFSGMTIGKKPVPDGSQVPELFDMFGLTTTLEPEPKDSKKKQNNIMASFSVNENDSNQRGSPPSTVPENLFAVPSTTKHRKILLEAFLAHKVFGFIQTPMAPGVVIHSIPPGMMINPAFASQSSN